MVSLVAEDDEPPEAVEDAPLPDHLLHPPVIKIFRTPSSIALDIGEGSDDSESNSDDESHSGDDSDGHLDEEGEQQHSRSNAFGE
jgi:hypothetical protein